MGVDRGATLTAEAPHRVIGHSRAKDLVSGTRLGRPLHPLLTDIPIGAFTSAALLDLVGGPRSVDAADLLVAVGLRKALPTTATGTARLADNTYGPEQRVGLVHASSEPSVSSCLWRR